MKIPQIKPHFRIEIVEPKHVYLLAENSTNALTGEFYCDLVPLLDGRHSFEEICELLAEQVGPEDVEYVLDRLQTKGYLTEATPQLSEPAAAFWSLLNIEPPLAYECLQQTTVYTASVGNVSTELLNEALTEIGIKTSPWESDRADNSLLVVLADDYLQPELADINKRAIATKQPWLLAKPAGGVAWLGPIFEPENTGCWECLAQRLRGHREVEASVLRQKQKSKGQKGVSKMDVEGCLPNPPAYLRSTMGSVINLITTEIAKWVVSKGSDRDPYFSG